MVYASVRVHSLRPLLPGFSFSFHLPLHPVSHSASTMDPNIDPKKRLQINFQGYNTDRTLQPSNDRVFPTTPSAFPQPVFGSSGGNSPNSAVYGSNPTQSPYGAPSGGYFAGYSSNQQQLPGYSAPNQYQNQYQGQQNLAAPPSSYQQRQAGYTTNDPTSPLVNQFANQNLGAPARQSSPFGRQPSPNQRAYTSNQQAQQSRSQASVHSNASQDSAGRLAPTPEAPPEKNPEKYSSNVVSRGQALHSFVDAFFRENISRARERNKR